MPTPLSGSTTAAKNLLHQQEPWYLLAEVDVPTTPKTILRLVRGTEDVDFGVTSAGVPVTYSRAAFSWSGIQQTSEGDLPSSTLTISNVTREAGALMETHDGFVGEEVILMIVHNLSLPTGVPDLSYKFTVTKSAFDEQNATAELGIFNPYTRPFPDSLFFRLRCPFLYRGKECKYAVDSGDPDFLSTCDKSLNGSNGCVAHGASETAAGVTKVHPERFGGFPGISKRSELVQV
jgi:phage-related protein